MDEPRRLARWWKAFAGAMLVGAILTVAGQTLPRAWERQVATTAGEYPLADALRTVAEGADLKVVMEMPAEEVRTRLPGGGNTVSELIRGLAEQFNAEVLGRGEIVVVRRVDGDSEFEESRRFADAVGGIANLLDELPPACRSALRDENWLPVEELPAKQQERVRAGMLKWVSPSGWEQIASEKEIVAAFVFDPYIEVGGTPERRGRRLYVRDRWRFLQFDGFTRGPHAWTLRPVGDGTHRHYDGGWEPTVWPDVFSGRTGRGVPARRGRAALPWERTARLPFFGEVGPYSLSALGPVLAVRRALADQQSSSVEAVRKGGELLARYEIWNAHCRDLDTPARLMEPDGMAPPPARGFLVRAALYWAEVADDSVAPPTGALIVAQTHPTRNSSRAWVDGPRVTSVRVQIVDYQVVPSTVSEPQKPASAQYVVQDQWRVEGEPKTVDAYVIPVTSENDVLAVWDVPTHPGVRIQTSEGNE